MELIGMVVAGATAIGSGIALGYWMIMKIIQSHRGKKELKKVTKQLMDMTMEMSAKMMKDTSKWEDLFKDAEA